jgi:DNA-directed RNA polymerase sigma subunit (sigma70/sigma32)
MEARADRMRRMRMRGMTYEAIGHEFGVTRERARQVITKPRRSRRDVAAGARSVDALEYVDLHVLQRHRATLAALFPC